jgi:Mg2+/Co2+ transporter CorB
MIIMSAFFSGSETAVVSCSRVKLKSKAKEGSLSARLLENLLASPKFLFSVVLVGTNLAIVFCTAEATAIAVRLFGNNGVVIATIVMTPILLVFGEVIPKASFLYHSDRLSTFVAPILKAFSYILWPLVMPVALLAGIPAKIAGGSRETLDSISTREELIYLYSGNKGKGVVTQREQKIIDGVFHFGVVRAADLMLPIDEVISFPYTSPISEVVKAANKYPYSRYPLISPDSGKVVGIISLFDLLGVESGEKLTSLMQKPFYALEDEFAEALFVRMKNESLHFAIVVDKEGRPKGILTLENIIENIVGDIASEYE